ncbi:hypothetical protein ALC56_03050 [Trachymyrmex septentrionalis]|uniref:Uncharacterized protein n=1 Tax=Trachymyrmex septentrionalis TaxID=34720 RepID=A0A195FRG5_9HYME|nr:hypothetical protein ALC56_03050 [Trachymyrmex septentrionalis]
MSSLRMSFRNVVQRTSGSLVDTLFINFSISSSFTEACKRFLSTLVSKSLKGQPPSYVAPLIPTYNSFDV